MRKSSVFSIMAEWIAEVLSMLFFAYATVQRTENNCVLALWAIQQLTIEVRTHHSLF